MRTDGAVACWGNSDSIQATRLALAGEFASVSAGWDHTCGVRRDGTVACWGYEEYGRGHAAGRGDSVSAGVRHTCAGLACWGMARPRRRPGSSGPG